MGSENGEVPPDLKAMVNLIQALVRANKRVITLSSILSLQKKLMRQYPSLILKFKVDRDFNVKCTMIGQDKDLEALGKLLEEFLRALMEILPHQNFCDKVTEAVRDLGQDATLELLASGAADLLPVELTDQIMIATDFGDRLNRLRNSDARTQALSIYERLYTTFFQHAFAILKPKEEHFRAFCKRLEDMVTSHFAFVRVFKVSAKYEVSLMVQDDAPLEVLLNALAHIFDSLVYGASVVWDPDEARNLGRKTALTVLGEFEELPDSSGVTASLLRGALSSRVRTGSLGLDRILDGGLERNSNTLLLSPNLIERDFLLSSFIRKGFMSGEGVLMVVSKMDTDRLLDMLSDDAHDPAGNIPFGKVKLHMYTPTDNGSDLPEPRDLVGLDDNEDMIETPKNLIDLNKFLIKAVRKYGPGPKRAIIEVLDSSMEKFGGKRLYWYLSRYVSILKENGFSTIFLASERVIGKELVENMMDLFENTISIRKRDGSYSYEIGRVAAKKPVLDPKFRLISISDVGLSITEE